MEENLVSNELSLSESAKDHLKTVGKWVYVISIIGLIGVMYIIVSLIYNYIIMSRMTDIPPGAGVGFYMIGLMTFFAFLMSILCFFPFYYLYKFSSNVKMAFNDDDSEALENSFRYLKLHYMSIGILILIYGIVYFSVLRIFS
jgi:hypothetical protein